MAAADLTRSTKGLFFISTLLCLLCFVSSSIDEDQLDPEDRLEKLMKMSLRLTQELFQFKEEHMTDPAKTPERMKDYMDLVDEMLSSPEMKGFDKLLPDDFPSVDTFFDNIRTFCKEVKVYIDREIENIRRKKTEF